MSTSINDLPLDCLRLIARTHLKVYRVMLMVRRFALTTISPEANLQYRVRFTKRKKCVRALGEPRIEYRLNGMLHRDGDEPAYIFCDDSEYRWHLYDMLHRTADKPALIKYEDVLRWYDAEDLTPITKTIAHQMWYRFGKLSRDNGLPAVIYRDADKYRRVYNHTPELKGVIVLSIDEYDNCRWYKDGRLHRDDDQPAIIESNGHKHWYRNGECYGTNLVAIN
jgi:hypothetical protein